MASNATRGVILMNLGSPDSTSVPDVRRYLVEFLMDERVIDKPYLLRALLVKGIISPFRAPKSAEAYHSIWTAEGSPLIAITRHLRDALAASITDPVEISMRYGKPSMKEAYDKLLAANPDLKEVVLLPLYPHYAMSSYETAAVHAREVYNVGKYPFNIRVIEPFYNDPLYIAALAESIRPNLKPGSHLVFSYHSVPEQHIYKGDITGNHCLKTPGCCTTPSKSHQFCYRHQCLETTRLVVASLGIREGDYSVSFQSKLGRAEWLKPSTTETMKSLPAKGIKEVSVVCPAFVSDCLETLEEVSMQEKNNFITAGGESYTFIPCMNVQPQWVAAISTWLTTNKN